MSTRSKPMQQKQMRQLKTTSTEHKQEQRSAIKCKDQQQTKLKRRKPMKIKKKNELHVIAESYSCWNLYISVAL